MDMFSCMYAQKCFFCSQSIDPYAPRRLGQLADSTLITNFLHGICFECYSKDHGLKNPSSCDCCGTEHIIVKKYKQNK